MAIGIILGIVIFLLFSFSVFTSLRLYKKGGSKAKNWAFISVFVTFVALIIVPFSFHTVDTGEIAVVKHLGEAKGTRHAGTHFDLWFTNRYQIYDAKVQNVDIPAATYSSDAQTMEIQMTLHYQIMSDKVLEIAKQYGSLEILQSRITSIATEKTKAVLSSHKAMSIIADRAAMSPAVEKAIKEAIGKDYYVDVTTVVLTNIDFSDAFEQAVEEKMIAEQNQLKAEYENQTTIAQAEATAKAKIVAAEAEAKANELLEKSVTDKILRKQYLEKWDGKLPEVVAGDESISVMIPTAANEN